MAKFLYAKAANGMTVRGALGMYHSVPESELKEYLAEQKRLEESGELKREIEEIAKRYSETRKRTK